MDRLTEPHPPPVAHILIGNGALAVALIVGLRRIDEYEKLAVVEGLGKV